MTIDLTKGNVSKSMLLFALPMILGNLFQQAYQIADTVIVGQCIGSDALAAVGASYALMVFLTSVIIGLCMGSSAAFSYFYGAGREAEMKNCFGISLLFILGITVLLNLLSFFLIDSMMVFMNIPAEIYEMTKEYLGVVFCGLFFIFLYNYFAAVLRSLGNSVTPLICLLISAVLNIILDFVFILNFQMGVAGAAWATVISQVVSAVLLGGYTLLRVPQMRLSAQNFRFRRKILSMVAVYSVLTGAQQSIMNFGILLVQGLVNSFGVSVMAAFAAGVKIDSFAYLPAQEFSNAFSTFVAQNRGAGQRERIKKGFLLAFFWVTVFCVVISAVVLLCGKYLLGIFIPLSETETIQIGIGYLLVEAPFYCLIGYLFLWYAYYRGIGKAGMSVVLTVISLGTRVVLAYLLSAIPEIGVSGIWWAVPIGWLLADLTGLFCCLKRGGIFPKQGRTDGDSLSG